MKRLSINYPCFARALNALNAATLHAALEALLVALIDAALDAAYNSALYDE